jgi:phosphatidate cytidylyltransferase
VNWKGFSTRIVLIAVAFPVLAVSIFVVPHLHHLAFNVIVAASSVLGALEMSALFRAKKIPTSMVIAPALAGTLPVGTWLEISGWLPPWWMLLWLPVTVGVVLVRAVLVPDDRKLSDVLGYVSSSTFSVLYPAFFLTWLVRFSSLPRPSLSILLFLCLVFGNDMAAYFAGSLWGASTRLNLPVSPQKSAVGFIAGFVGSLIIVGLFMLIVPGYPPFGIGLNIVLALSTGVTVMVGDLLESGLKRSAGVKDSGVIIPGRGGMLDSVDSMLFTAPLFYAIFSLVGW